MLGINFTCANGRFEINLANLPEECDEVVVNLPGGSCLTHQFGQAAPPLIREDLPGLIREFVDFLEVNEGRVKNTLKGYRNRLRQFYDWLGQRDQAPADAAAWLAYYAHLKRTLAPHTVKGHYHILKRFADWLQAAGRLRRHPLADVLAPELPKDELPKAIFRDHIKAMLQAAETPRDLALLLFFRDTGCRAAEALSLTWADLEVDQGRVSILGKGNKARFLYLRPVTRQALDIYRQSYKHNKTAPLWKGTRGPLTYNGLYKTFKRLAEAVGIGDEIFNPHSFRHAFGRDATMAGCPTAQLQKILGHEDIKTTSVYTRFNDTEVQEAHSLYSPVEDDLDLLPLKRFFLVDDDSLLTGVDSKKF